MSTTYKSALVHRIVAAQTLGRPLLPGEVVHHIDGNGENNEPSNLQVMQKGDHGRLHRTNAHPAICDDCKSRLAVVKGKCNRCHQKALRAAFRLANPRTTHDNRGLTCSQCHERPAIALGLCNRCYQKSRSGRINAKIAG